MRPDLVYQIALTLIPNIGPVQAKTLLQYFNPDEIFTTKTSSLEKIEGIGAAKATAIRRFNDFTIAEEEIRFMEKYDIRPLFITDTNYPKRLLNCYDSPVLLYYKGNADLNTSKVISIIGTRNNTEYGRQLTEKLVDDLSNHDILIMSGLAYGIDSIAHRSAVRNNLPTVGVLAHGLDQVYPADNAGLAKDMISNGGLLTEFRRSSKPDKHNFPIRNRIVAGMSDATIVVETGIKGGSMITAELANNYNKDVFAFPGKTTDPKSSGCNYLIKNNKAILLTNAEQLLETMGWEKRNPRIPAHEQKELFIELNPEEKVVVSILKDKPAVHIDEINLKSGLSNSLVAAAILRLELENVIVSLPGKQYQLS